MSSNFNSDDVTKVASSLINHAIAWDEGYTNAMNPHDGYKCIFCSAGEYQNAEDLKHSIDCPVLIAQDLLT